MGRAYADGYKDGARDTKKVFEDTTLQQKTISDLMDERDQLVEARNGRQRECVRLMAERDEARASLGVLLDQVDYTSGACGPAHMVGAVLPTEVIDKARRALKGGE